MSRRHRGKTLDGVLIVDKPQGMTSNAVLQRAKRLLGAAKAGHTGSLDPLATGVLPLCFGEATKFSQLLLDADKCYRAAARLGQVTETGDSDGALVREEPVPALDEAAMERVLDRFRGGIEQVPSMYSALKHRGRPLYQWAREGVTVERPPRQVQIHHLELLGIDRDGFEIEVHCSKGTYIRTLVEDIGRALGCGAHVTALRRLQAGPFCLEDAVTLEALEERDAAAREALLGPVDAALGDLPPCRLEIAQGESILNGQPVKMSGGPEPGWVRLYLADRFVGLGEIVEGGRLLPRRLLSLNPSGRL